MHGINLDIISKNVRIILEFGPKLASTF